MGSPRAFAIASGLGLVLAGQACAQGKGQRKDEQDEFEGIGLRDASSEPPPGVLVPIADGDLPATTERGRVLHRMERALVLAYEQGITRVGGSGSDIVLPIVDVDPGAKSAQVVFVRWRAEDAKDLAVDKAERWLLVSILLDPDRVLDVELLAGAIEPASHLERRVMSLLAAARALADAAPGDMFHLFDLYERSDAADAKSPVVGHVYALSADGDGADLEVMLAAPKKRKPPTVDRVIEVHPRGAASQRPIVVAKPRPCAITVVRAMLFGPDAGPVDVVAERDARFTVASRDGVISPGATP